MAIDKVKTKELLTTIDDLFETIPVKNKFVKQKVKDVVLGPALEEIREMLDESRPPVLMLIGRRGHGKSSLINALAGKEVATVNDFRPQQPSTEPYLITFPEAFSTWKVIDTRGIFESSQPDGALADDSVQALQADIMKHQPDVILHVIAAPEISAAQHDMAFRGELKTFIKQNLDYDIPLVMVLNKADTFANPREWPPEDYAVKAAQLAEQMDYVIDTMLEAKKQPLNANMPYYGYELLGSDYMALIPVASLAGDLWNMDTLSDFIGTNLHASAQLDFYQAQKRKKPLKRLSSSLIKRFSTLAGGIGATPIPIADMAVLLPLQLLMISLIGGLAGRPASKETALEYLAAAGINVAAGFGFREVARQASKLIPFGGIAISGGVASASTWSIGKSAEAYFFNNELKLPKTFGKPSADDLIE